MTVVRVAHVAHEAYKQWGANRPNKIPSLMSRRHILTMMWSYNTQNVQGRVATRTSKTLCLRSMQAENSPYNDCDQCTQYSNEGANETSGPYTKAALATASHTNNQQTTEE